MWTLPAVCFGKKETRPPLRRAGGFTMVATVSRLRPLLTPTRGSSSHQHHLQLYVQYVSGGRNSRRYLPKNGRFFHGNEWKRGRFCIPAEPGCEIRLLSNSRISTTYGVSPILLECIQGRIWALMRPRKAQGGGYGLDEMVRDATEAAKAWNRSHEAPTRSRGQAR